MYSTPTSRYENVFMDPSRSHVPMSFSKPFATAANIFGKSPRRFFDMQHQQCPPFTRPTCKPDSPPLWMPPTPPPRKRCGHKQLNLDGKLKFDSKLRSFSGFGRRRSRSLRRQKSRVESHCLPSENRGHLSDIDEEIRQTIVSDALSAEDQIFLKQMAALDMDRAFRTKLFAAREAVAHAAGETMSRVQKQAERDIAVQLQTEDEAAKAKQRELLERQMRLEGEKKLKALREKLENERCERARIKKLHEEEARKRREAQTEERRRLEREQVARMEEECRRLERERAERLEWEQRQAQYRAARMEEEWRHRAARMEEEWHQSREHAARLEAERELSAKADVGKQFALYDERWAYLRAGLPVDNIAFDHFPWPVLGPKTTLAIDITYERVRDFVLHSLRKGVEGKSPRDKARLEALKWHPDKFNVIALPNIAENDRQKSSEVAGNVMRILTQIMSEES